MGIPVIPYVPGSLNPDGTINFYDEAIFGAEGKLYETFDAYVRNAKACIIPLKHDTGASGQSVMLRLMRNRKTIIATDFGSVRGYIVNGKSGLLVADIERDLPAIVAGLERDPAAAKSLGKAAYERYCEYFSLAAGGEALGRILEPSLAE